ncbi:MAG: tandem-95 repeat protein, partial [Planctomycetaceae bacterium]|nr:tandem-95 repeat protein [Planctomycetaceae bacterium]
PTLNYNGPDSFTYTVRDSNNQLSNVATVSITVTPVNDAPTANNDNAVTNQDVPVIINILANDTDPDSPIDPSSVVIVTPPANGTTSINPVTGAVTYTPNPGFTGTNTFTYTVKDTAGATSNIATVTIRVNNPPIAVNDTATTPEDVPVAINILANDTDTDGTLVPSSVTIITGPLHGTLVVNPSTGVVTYTPNQNYNGADSFTYTVRDNDGAESNVATVSITILAVNDPPVAVDDPTTTDIGAPVVIDVLANDTDVDGTLVPSSVTIVSGPTNGTATINPVTGAITYTPNPGFVGGDLIVYTVKDNLGATSNQANVPIRVGLPSVIAGKVFLDTNNNGVQDVGEAGIVGVSLTLLKTDGPITFVRNTVTGADGSYSFIDLIPGTYTLVQSQPGVFLDGIETPAPGVPVGSITNDQFIDIQLGSGVNAVGFNFAERGLKAEFLASYQGARVFLASGMGGTLDIFAEPAAGLSLAAGDIWISLDGGYSGPLKFLATPSGGTASLTLYDSNLNAVASSVPGSGAASFTYQGTTGSPYFLRVSGTSTNVEVSALDPTPDPVNVAPVLPPIGNQTVQPGQTLSFIAKATDANAGDKLTYALAGTIPAGASIDPVTGKFTWAAPANFQGSVSFTIVVMDKGSPVMSDWETFDVVAGQVTTPGITAADANAFVRSLYVDLLGRNADSGGLNQHVQRLLAGTSRQEIVASFVNSTEYLGRVVDGMYTKYLRRTADAAGRSSWIAAMSAGTTATDVAIAFLSSSEYASRHVSNAAFVDGLYRDVLGRAPDAGGYNSNVTKLQSGGSRAALAKFFLTSGERVDQVIAEQYGKVLGRAVDPTGKLSFAAALAGSLDAADELATALASSQEYLAKAIRKFR